MAVHLAVLSGSLPPGHGLLQVVEGINVLPYTENYFEYIE
jgi:hypothetical protein